jgi:hypothetical protein
MPLLLIMHHRAVAAYSSRKSALEKRQRSPSRGIEVGPRKDVRHESAESGDVSLWQLNAVECRILQTLPSYRSLGLAGSREQAVRSGTEYPRDSTFYGGDP